MILGLLSDTHGHAARTAAAVRVLETCGARAFVHCGDVGGPAVLDALAGRRVWLVCGNSDDGVTGLVHYAQLLGFTARPAGPLFVDVGQRRLAVFHGHEAALERLLRKTADNGAPPADIGPCDYVLHGHTHLATDRDVGPLRVINPGALLRAVVHTAATLDLRTGELRFWEIDETHPAGEAVQYLPEGHF